MTEVEQQKNVVATEAFPSTLEVSPGAWKVMKADAESRFPNECCGFFYGKDGEIRTVSFATVVDNSKEGDQRRRFEISPLDYMRAEKKAIAEGLDLLGVYHSHPNHPAIPSIHDLKQAVPHFSYIILSVQKGTYDHVRSWRLTEEGQFAEETLHLDS
ncbi:MAG: M67 family metallopeptidase [Bacteroidota bacterium]